MTFRSGSELTKDSSSFSAEADTTLSTLPNSRRSSEVVKKVSRGALMMDKALEVQEAADSNSDMPRVIE